MEHLEDNVVRFINAHNLFRGAGRVLLAISGGADSIALLHVMYRLVDRGVLHLDLACVHVNHGLRGAAGDADEAFVAEQAARLGLPLTTRTVDAATHAKTHRLSIETAGRQLRLACLSEAARSQGCAWIATGHQKDDNAETVLHRLRRGTGFRGLGGIWSARQLCEGLTWARPLLDNTRAEIVAYLQARNLKWREDHTNADCVHTRNYIRHCLLPKLQSEASGSLVEQLASLAMSSQRLHAHVAELAEIAEAQHVHTGTECRLEARALAALPNLVAVELIRRLLTSLGCGERDLTRYHYQGILELAMSDSTVPASILPGGFLACRRGEQIVLRRHIASPSIPVDTPSVEIAIPGTTDSGDYRIEARILSPSDITRTRIEDDKNPLLEYLDLGRIKGSVVVRRRRRGDHFQPLGLAGQKKVGKFLTAARTPEVIRQKVLVFEDSERIIWVCPVRISERVKVTDQTRQILVLEVTDVGFG